METSRKGITLIKHFESLHDGDLSLIGLQPKQCPAGIWTEGYGHAILDKKGRQVKGLENKYLAYECSVAYTEKEAEELLSADLLKREWALNKLGLDLNQNQFDVLISFIYNLGFTAFKNSTLLQLIKNNSLDFNIAYEFVKWRKAGGVILPGLVLRRREEAQLYFTGRINY